MNNKRTLTKAGGIVSIVAWALNILLGAYLLGVLAYFMMVYSSMGVMDPELQAALLSSVITVIIPLAISIILVVYSIRTLKYSKLDCKEYASKKGTILFVAIVNLLNVVYSIISMIDSGFDWTSVVSILIVLALLASAILILIDFSKAQKEANAEKLAEQTAQNIESANQTQTVVDAQVKEETIEDKLEKLNKMKADGLISEEEYNQMKADLLK